MTLGRSPDARISMASCPSQATTTAQPPVESRSATDARWPASSSTTRIVDPVARLPDAVAEKLLTIRGGR